MFVSTRSTFSGAHMAHGLLVSHNRPDADTAGFRLELVMLQERFDKGPDVDGLNGERDRTGVDAGHLKKVVDE